MNAEIEEMEIALAATNELLDRCKSALRMCAVHINPRTELYERVVELGGSPSTSGAKHGG